VQSASLYSHHPCVGSINFGGHGEGVVCTQAAQLPAARVLRSLFGVLTAVAVFQAACARLAGSDTWRLSS